MHLDAEERAMRYLDTPPTLNYTGAIISSHPLPHGKFYQEDTAAAQFPIHNLTFFKEQSKRGEKRLLVSEERRYC